MRALIILALSVFTFNAFAEETLPFVLSESRDAKGRKLQFRTDTKTLLRQPHWLLGAGEDPPLSIERADRIAYSALMRRFPKAHSASYLSLKLLRGVFDYSHGRLCPWFYVITVEPVFEHGEEATWGAPLDIVILLDGTVVDPVVAK